MTFENAVLAFFLFKLTYDLIKHRLWAQSLKMTHRSYLILAVFIDHRVGVEKGYV